jgi:hypothetical protein
MAVKVVEQIPDPDDDDAAPLAYDPNPASPLDELVADVQAEIAEPTRIRHPGKPDYVLTFRSHVEPNEAQSCMRRTKNAKDPVKTQNALFLAETNLGLEKNGVQVRNSDGLPVTFRDPELLTALGVKTAVGAVVKFIPNPGHIIALADLVMRKAGYGTEAEVVGDPTLSD